MASLNNQMTQLEQKIKERGAYDHALASEINARQQKVGDLNKLVRNTSQNVFLNTITS